MCLFPMDPIGDSVSGTAFRSWRANPRLELECSTSYDVAHDVAHDVAMFQSVHSG